MGRWRNSPFCWRLVLPCAASSTPFLWCLPKETGWSPKEKRLGWWRPREVSGPTRLSHSRGRCHSAAKVSASRTYFITRPRGEGFGSDVDWRLKVFCPAFLQKSGRGPGAEPWPRAAARGTLLVLKKRRRGSKGEPSPGVPPFAPAYAGAISLSLLRNKKRGTRYRVPRLALAKTHTTPSAIMAAATFRKPATFAPTMRSPVLPTSTEAS